MSLESSSAETGMPTIGYVAITLGALGAIATFSFYLTPFAIILALPSVVLCTKAHRIYKSRVHKANGVLVVFLVLNWIGTIVSGLFLAVTCGWIIYFYGFRTRQTTDGPNLSHAGQITDPGVKEDHTPPPPEVIIGRMYARGLNAASPELNQGDLSQVNLIFAQIPKMASAEGGLIKAWGTGVGSEEIFKRESPDLIQAWTASLVIAKYYQAGISDQGAKRFLGSLLEAESAVCDTYQQLHSCVLAGDYDAANRNIASLNVLSKHKGELYTDMISGMRTVGGSAVDSYVIEGINEETQNLKDRLKAPQQ